MCGMLTRLFKSIIISTGLQRSIVFQKVSTSYSTYHIKFADMGSLMIWVNLENLFTVGIVDRVRQRSKLIANEAGLAAIVAHNASRSSSIGGSYWSQQSLEVCSQAGTVNLSSLGSRCSGKRLVPERYLKHTRVTH